MQDKHIDKQKQSKSDNQAVQAICQDLPNDAPEHYWAWRNAPKSIPSQYEYCMSCGRINATEWLTTEQLAIWNKALELVESMLERGFGFPKEGTEDFKRGKFTKHISSQELIEAIQQQIDKLGGKE